MCYWKILQVYLHMTPNIDPENSIVVGYNTSQPSRSLSVQGATSAPLEGGPQLKPEEGQKAGPDEPEQVDINVIYMYGNM